VYECHASVSGRSGKQKVEALCGCDRQLGREPSGRGAQGARCIGSMQPFLLLSDVGDWGRRVVSQRNGDGRAVLCVVSMVRRILCVRWKL
jgi:hypothetical protein